ncbi:EAL domain-containing protein, partial [Rhizobium leguminosarum]|uniref:EAL domain-containing protein n=1 Tax=Rhizobium leguminosarum TaxID=384 RepID=UPI003F97B4CC
SFVSSLETYDNHDKVIKAIIALGVGLGVTITAEGIEEESLLQRLHDLGCDICQGYLLGMPAPVAELATDHISARIL